MIQSALFLALSLAPTGDHAALHPARANLYVDLPDVPAMLAAYGQAPLVRLMTDPEVGEVVRRVAGLPEEIDPLATLWAALADQMGDDARLAAEELCGIAGEIRSISFSAAGLEGQPEAADGAPPADLASSLARVELIGVLELSGSDAPLRLIELAAVGLLAVEGPGPAAVTLLHEERQVHWFSIPDGPEEGRIWMVAADRLLVLGALGARPEAIQARIEAGETLLGAESIRLGAERFSAPKGATIHDTSWWLPEEPFYARLLEGTGGMVGPAGGLGGFAADLLGGFVPLEPQVSRTRMQLREGRFVQESFERSLAPPSDEPPRMAFGHAPIAPSVLAGAHPEAVGVWATSISVEGLVGLAQRIVESLPGIELEELAELDPAPWLEGLEGVLATLGQDVAVYLLPIPGLKIPQVHAVLGLEDPVAFEERLTALALAIEEQAGGAVRVDTRPYRRMPVVTLRPDLSSLGLPPMVSIELAVGIVGERAIAGLSAMDVRKEMRRMQAAEEGAHPAAEKGTFPEGVHAACWVDWGALVGSAYDSARALAALAPGEMLPVDVTLLPESKLFTRFFQPSRSWSRPMEGGKYTYSESSFGHEVPLMLAAATSATLLSARASGAGEWEFSEPIPTTPAAATPEDPVQATRQALQEVKLALVLYRSEKGELPERLEQLAEPTETFPDGFLGGSAPPADAWGRPLRYERTGEGQGFELWSVGPDGQDERGGGDDVVAP